MLVFNYRSGDKDCQRRRFVADRAINIGLNRPVYYSSGIGYISIISWVNIATVMASAIWTNVDAAVEGYAVVESEGVAVADMIETPNAIVVEVVVVVVCIVSIVAMLVL